MTGRPLQWLRLYAEAVDDEKLRLLAFEDRWHFIAILCCKAQGLLDGEDADLRMRKVCVKLGLDERELGEVAFMPLDVLRQFVLCRPRNRRKSYRVDWSQENGGAR